MFMSSILFIYKYTCLWSPSTEVDHSFPSFPALLVFFFWGGGKTGLSFNLGLANLPDYIATGFSYQLLSVIPAQELQTYADTLS